MGWSTGSDIMAEVIESLLRNVADDEARNRIYTRLIPAFEKHDWDTQDECRGLDPAFDKALAALDLQQQRQ